MVVQQRLIVSTLTISDQIVNPTRILNGKRTLFDWEPINLFPVTWLMDNWGCLFQFPET
jgi:hypothetical protein